MFHILVHAASTILYNKTRCIYVFIRQAVKHTVPSATQRLRSYCTHFYLYIPSGFGGLGVACWPLVPKFAGSNPAEAVGFLRAKKSSARLPSEGK